MADTETRCKQYFLARFDGGWAEVSVQFAAEPESVRTRVEALWAAEECSDPRLAGPAMPEAESDSPLPFGTLLGDRYELRESLGAGAFARVYRALDRRVAGKETAVKVFHSGLLTEALLAPEVRAMARVNHPGIMRVTDVGATPDGRSYLVRDYFAGETLRSRITRSTLGAGEARNIIRQIAEALSAAHAEGLIHCDLKPENILINPAGRIALIDFGLADLFENQSRAVLLSSNIYAAPELMGGLRPQPPADIYSLGRIWTELGATSRFAHSMQYTRPDQRPPSANAVVAAISRQHRRHQFLWLGTLAVLALAVGAVTMRLSTPREPFVSPLLPVTSSPGAESEPSLTPDGKHIYFTWTREDSKVTGIFRVPIDGGTPVPVSPPADDARYPVVSPDGSRLAYLRYLPTGDQMQICWMPLSGGSIKTADAGWPVWMDWMPGGTRLLVGRKRGEGQNVYELGILDLESGAWELLQQDDDRNRIRPRVSPDGTRVAYHMQLPGGRSQAVVGELTQGRIHDVAWSKEYAEMQRPSWTADSRHIVFLAGRQNNRQVHVAPFDNLANATLLPGFGQKLDHVAIARNRNVAVVAQSQEDQNLWRIDLDGPGGPAKAATRIAESNWDDEEPTFVTAAGKVLFVSDQSGGEQIWESNYDGSEPRRLTEYMDAHQLRVFGLAGRKQAVSGGRFGKEEGFHIISLDPGRPAGSPPSLIPGRVIGAARDGESVFVSRDGEVRRIALDGADRGLLQVGDIYRMEQAIGAPDLWYTFKFFSETWRAGAAHGEPLFRRAFVAGRHGLYYVSAGRQRVLQYRPYDGGPSRDLLELPQKIGYGMALRDDERMLVVTVMERTGVDLLAVKDFRLE